MILTTKQVTVARAWNRAHPEWVHAVIAASPPHTMLTASDGSLDPEALATLQQFKGITADGMAGPETLRAMGVDAPSVAGMVPTPPPPPPALPWTRGGGADTAGADAAGVDGSAAVAGQVEAEAKPRSQGSGGGGWILIAAALGVALLAKRR